MTQEEEQLLFTDLSGRLRYGVICQIDYCDDAVLWGIPNADTFTFCDGVIERYISQVTPYLRPMSSMTYEEESKYNEIQGLQHWTVEDGMIQNYGDAIDWLNEKGFDFRGLIPMGLALPAKPGMYDSN